eukprot:Sspe_Gene.92273::Locus_64241_Transcript_1_1_Confidence_1.000_Length_476::g.92273::m.92273
MGWLGGVQVATKAKGGGWEALEDVPFPAAAAGRVSTSSPLPTTSSLFLLSYFSPHLLTYLLPFAISSPPLPPPPSLRALRNGTKGGTWFSKPSFTVPNRTVPYHTAPYRTRPYRTIPYR